MIVYDGRQYQLESFFRPTGFAVKAQLHCHSTNSDGQDAPAAMAQAYKDAGYDFLAITDHDFITPDPMIPGLLYAPSVEEIGGAYHAHVVAYDVDVQTMSASFPSVIAFHRQNGRAVSLAHPLVNGNTPIIPGEHAMLTTDGYNFVEVYNGLSTNAETVWDELLTRGKRVYGLATDDCHGIASVGFNRGWVVVNAQAQTKEAVLAALRAGDFYASNGADIHVSVQDATICAECSAPCTISFVGKNGGVYHLVTGALTAEYTVRGDEGYIRCVATRPDGKKAWGQPVFITPTDGTDHGYRAEDTVSGVYCQPLRNSDFDIWPEGESFVFDGIPATGYTADGWKAHSDFTSTRVDRVDVTVPVARGDMGRYCARLTVVNKGAGTAMRMYQALPTQESLLFRGKTVAAGVWMRRNAACTSGTVSVYVYAATGVDEPAATTGRQTLHVATVACAELDTSRFTLIQAPVDINWNRNQIALVVQINPDVPNGSAIDVKRGQLCVGAKVQPYQRKSVQDELLACQAFFTKSYDTDTPPGTATSRGAYLCHALSVYSLYDKNVRFPRSMRRAPTVTLYSTSGAEGSLRERDYNVDRAAYVQSEYTGENGFVVAGDKSLVANRIYEFQYKADARL